MIEIFNYKSSKSNEVTTKRTLRSGQESQLEDLESKKKSA